MTPQQRQRAREQLGLPQPEDTFTLPPTAAGRAALHAQAEAQGLLPPIRQEDGRYIVTDTDGTPAYFTDRTEAAEAALAFMTPTQRQKVQAMTAAEGKGQGQGKGKGKSKVQGTAQPATIQPVTQKQAQKQPQKERKKQSQLVLAGGEVDSYGSPEFQDDSLENPQAQDTSQSQPQPKAQPVLSGSADRSSGTTHTQPGNPASNPPAQTGTDAPPGPPSPGGGQETSQSGGEGDGASADQNASDDNVQPSESQTSDKKHLTGTTEESINYKLHNYLLAPEHPEGGPKAAWFKGALGFTANNADEFGRQLVFDSRTAKTTKTTAFGQKFNQIIDLKGANGKVISVTVCWIKNPDGVIRLVTIIPEDK